MLRVNSSEGYLLMKLSEECVEVAHAVSKLLTFGRRRGVGNPLYDNDRQVEMEIVDILGTVELILHNRVLSNLHIVDDESIRRKMFKIRKSWENSLKVRAGWEGVPEDIRLPGDMEKDDRQMEFDF